MKVLREVFLLGNKSLSKHIPQLVARVHVLSFVCDPCISFLWNNIDARIAKLAPKNKNDNLEQYKKRFRNTAKSKSKVLLRKAAAHMEPRIKAFYDAEGDHIKVY